MRLPLSVERSLAEIGGIEALKRRLRSGLELEKYAGIFKALSDPIRLRVTLSLLQAPLCVCVLKRITEVSDSRLSYHLSFLERNGLVQGKREGNWIIYGLTDSARALLESLLKTTSSF